MPKYISQLARMLEEAGLDPEKMLDAYADPVKAYKLFRMKDDELYPLFVNADKPVLMDEWLPAEAGQLTSGGKVKSKIGDLAYRPGWHAGEYPLATHIGGKATERGKIPTKPNYRPDDQVWAEIEMPNMVNWQQVANDRMQYSKAGKPIPRTAHITDQVPYGGHYRYKTNPNMTGDWLIGGDMKVNRILEDAEVRELNRGAGVEDLPRLRNLQKRKGYVPAAAAGAVGLGALGDSEDTMAMSGDPYNYGTGEPGVPLADPDAWMYEDPALMEGVLGELPESVQAGILAAGKETDKMITGARDLFGSALGIDDEWRGKNQATQKANDRVFAPVEDEYTAATMIGSMAPYLATGALYGTLGPIGAGVTAATEGALYYQEDPEDRLTNAALGGGLGFGVGKGLQKWGDRVSQNPWKRGR